MLLSLMLVARLTSGFAALMDGGGTTVPYRVRGTDTLTRAVIDEGCRRSPVFANLVQDVERSKFVVYVEAVGALRNGKQGALLHYTNEAQYLRIYVRRDLQTRDQIAVLAHELQHVREMVQAGISANADEMDMLFRQIGREPVVRGERQQLETSKALRVGDLVAQDLRRMHGPNISFCRAPIQ
mgnify:FL=1